MGMALALTHLIGNCVGTVVVEAGEGNVDRERAHAVRDGRVQVDLSGDGKAN